MIKLYNKSFGRNLAVWVLFSLLSLIFSSLSAQINFSQSELNFNGLGNVSAGVTSLMYGPDGRLYVAEYPGTIKILTIQRNAQNDYVVTAIETLTGVTDIVNHDDDGSPCSGFASDCNKRETTGLTVAGTASNPIIYVASSDFRIGAGTGGGNGDVDLDTNSGIITRFSWNGSSWDVVDLVRGLPRSEENHATNGLEFATVNGTDYLIVASGGITNAGGPSINFVLTCEYALSGAVLSVNLDMLNSLGIQTDANGRQYIYDIPTLDDPTRANVNDITDPNNGSYNGIDVNDPFGGNDGLNQAMIVPGGPVQIFSPGYRNAYDLVLTQSGAVYVTDNGANQGWGGFPANEGGGSATNNYVTGEPGSNSSSGGEMVNNVDHLELITTNIQNYVFGSFYAGHPNPTRANPNGAGLYTAGTTGAVFRTQKYDPDGSTSGSTTNAAIALPANWPPVQVANAVEGDWRGPGIGNPDGPNDNPVTTWGTNTNGIDEYTASNFGGIMQGDLIAGHNNGVLRRVELNPDGSLQKLTTSFASGLGGNALGITCNSDTEPFPGTIWAGTLNGKIVVLEPDDLVNCINPGEPGYNPNADYDNDGYTNQDEEDNGTDPCNGGSQPNDFDKLAGAPLVSDLNDTDDDNDAIPDSADPFQLGNPNAGGSDAFTVPIQNGLFNDQQGLGGIFGLGMTGLMNNGTPNPNWLQWLDDRGQGPNPDDVLGGAPGLMTSHMTSGTANGSANTQEKGYQYGVQVDQSTGIFTVSGNLINFNGPLQLYGNTAALGGELGLFIGDGTQSNFIKFVITTSGLTAQQEINDQPQTPINVPIAIGNRPQSDVVFYFVVNPFNGEVNLEYSLDGGNRTTAGTITAQGSILNAIQQVGADLAVGFIGTSNTSGVELEGTWDFLNVLPETPAAGIRLNAGGPEVVHNSLTFAADNSFTGGKVFANTSVPLPALYQTERSASPPTFSYNFPLANDDYKVILHFAEIYWAATGGGPGGVGSRIFDVSVEGNLVLDNYDIIADVGSETMVTKAFNVSLTDGTLNIAFSALASDGGVDQPKVSAIEILSSSQQHPPITLAAIPNQFNQVGESSNFNVNASGGDPAENFIYSISGQPAGINIGSSTGQVSGTIAAQAATGGPLGDGVHQVSVNVSKPGSTPASTLFSWNVGTGWADMNEPDNYTGRHECSFVQAGDKFYLFGGRENPKNLDVYDFNSNSWTTLSNSAPHDFNHFQTVEYQGLIWVIGAFSTNAYPTELNAEYIWIFNPATQQWIQGPQIPAARRRGSGGLVVYNDKFYMVGGNTNGHSGGFVPWLDQYDPLTGTWTQLANAPRSRDHFHAVVIGSKLYAAAGRQTAFPNDVFNQTLGEVDVYDFNIGSWSTLPAGQNLPTHRGGAAAVNFNNKLLVIGGESSASTSALATTEQYDPLTSSWSSLPNLLSPRHGTQAIVSGNGAYITAGSPVRGGGSQTNMEYLGSPNPAGVASVASVLSGPASLQIEANSSANLNLNVSGGNQGIFIRSFQITGPNAANFSITSGNLTNSLLKINAQHPMVIAYNSNQSSGTATLVVNHGATAQTSIPLLGGGGSPQNGVTSLTLVDANTDLDLFNLNEGMQIDAATVSGIPLNVRANTNPATVGSVFLSLTGPLSNNRNENVAPYALLGDTGGDYSGNVFPLGNYTMSATAYSGSNQSGTNLGNLTINFSISSQGGGNQPPNAVASATPLSGDAPLTVNFTGSNSTDDTGITSYSWNFGDGTALGTVADPSHSYASAGTYNAVLTVTDGGGLQDTDAVTIVVNTPSQNGVVSLVLINTNTGQVIQTLSNGVQINSATVQGTPLSIRANTNPATVGSVFLNLSGPLNNTRNENVAPYSLFGDSGGTYTGNIFSLGNYTISATAYSGSNQGGTNLGNLTLAFSISDQGGGNDPPTAVASATPLSGDAPLTVNFTGSNSTDDIGITSYSWNFGDGTANSSQANPSHSYTNAGTYNVVLTVTDGGGLQDAEQLTIVANEPSQNGVLSLTLVDADLDVDMFNLANNQQIDVATTQGKGLSIRANTNPATVGSVRLTISGPVNNARTEGVAPYSLFGDGGGNYTGVTFPVGSYTASATAYSGSNLSGSNLGTLTLQFSITQIAAKGAGLADLGNELNETLIPEPEDAQIFDIRLIPNPATYETELAISNLSVTLSTINLYDMSGRLVRSINPESITNGAGIYKLNVSGLEEGVYSVRFMDLANAIAYTYKLVIKK